MKKNDSQHRIGSPELVTKKECLLRPIFAKNLDHGKYDFGGCNSAEECLLPKQDVEGSNPFTRSTFCLVEIRGYADLHSPLSF